MNKECQSFFDATVAGVHSQAKEVSESQLNGLSYFVSALYLSRDINEAEEKELRRQINQLRIDRGIILSGEPSANKPTTRLDARV